jgi:diguanylate cyclase (GGDEF)-like protein
MDSTRSIEILCLVLAALVLQWSHALAQSPWQASALMGAFAVTIVMFRARVFFPSKIRMRLTAESWTMLAFITGVLWLSGRAASPLLNLYLLPVILSALTLGRLVTLMQVAAIAACHFFLALATPGAHVASLEYASQAVGQLAPVLLVAYLISTLSADVTEARERIENLAQVDSLTGLFNQRTFNEVWQREHAECVGAGRAYAFLMIDVDRLGDINEAFGHDAGNSALNLVAQCLQRSIRSSDHAARYVGDEFAVLLPGASAEVAEAVVKRIRHNVYKTTLDVRSRMIRCTVSIGVANYPKDGRDVRELQSVAERFMYRDKELRRAPRTAAKV